MASKSAATVESAVSTVSTVSTVDVVSPTGKKTGSVDLPGEIFDVQVNVPLLHQVVVAQLAAARQGTHSTKTRGEVAGGGRKPYKQKGTGRARQGSIRAPQFVGGGVVHGPQPRSYDQRTPKKMKAAALRGALSDRARDGRIHIVTGLVEGSSPSTKSAVAIIEQLTQRAHVLVVVERKDTVSWKSLRNVDRVHLIWPDQLNTYDVLVSDDVVFTQAAFDAFLAGPAKGKAVKAVAAEFEVAEFEVAEVEVAEVEVAEVEVADVEVAEAVTADADVADADVADAEVADAEVADADAAEVDAALEGDEK
jgi:large subunit ribosomal protein L4